MPVSVLPSVSYHKIRLIATIDKKYYTSNSVDGLGNKSSKSNGVPITSKLPKPISGIDFSVVQAASILCAVNKAEIVASGLIFLEECAKYWGAQVGLRVVEKGLLLDWSY